MCDQLSMLPDLDRASDTREANLCRSWKNAVLNDCDVFIENRIDIEVTKSKKTCYPRITIHCAMEYPKVYYSFDIMGPTCVGGGYPGHDSRNFDVHEHAANVCLMVEHELRSKIRSEHKIPENMISEIIDDFKNAITTGEEIHNRYETKCAVCGKMVSNGEILESEKGKLCIDCWEKEEFKDDEGNETDENDGWSVCPICKEKVGQLCKSGLCAECDYKKKHPEAQKKLCEDCIHFRYHNLYDENDNTECCCKLHLEGKNRHEWTYLCKDFVKVDSVEDFDRKYEGLMKYASYKGLEKCEDCGKKFRFTYNGVCLPCYDKKRKKAEEIARGFIAEGWKEVPDNEKNNAMYEQNGWIDERNMDAFEPRKGTRFFLIDVKTLTWKCFFKKGVA